MRLRRWGFHIAEISNYKTDDVKKSFVHIFSEKQKTIKFLEDFIKLKNISPALEEGDGIIDIQIVLGEDFL